MWWLIRKSGLQVDYAHFDIYRLKDGKIVEHWDNKEVMPDKQDLTNLGKF